MNKAEFTDLIINPDKLGSEHIDTLKKIVADYPFFSTAQVLLAKALLNTNHYEYEKQLKTTALSVAKREVLFQFLNNQPLDLYIENSLMRVSDEMKAEKVSRPDFEIGKEEQEALLNEAQNIISNHEIPIIETENIVENTTENILEKFENNTDNFDFEEPILENIVHEIPTIETEINTPIETEIIVENTTENRLEKFENNTDNFDFEEPILENIVHEIPAIETEINTPIETEIIVENGPEYIEVKIENDIDNKSEINFQLTETEGTLVRFVNTETFLPNFDEASLFADEQIIETITKSVLPNTANYSISSPLLQENEEHLIEQQTIENMLPIEPINETENLTEITFESLTENQIEAVINDFEVDEINHTISLENILEITPENIEIVAENNIVNNEEIEAQNDVIPILETVENNTEIAPVFETVNVPIETEIPNHIEIIENDIETNFNNEELEAHNDVIPILETVENNTEITPVFEAINVPIETEIETENETPIEVEELENDYNEALNIESIETEEELNENPNSTTTDANNLNFFEWLEISKNDSIEVETVKPLEIVNYEDTAFVEKIKQIIKSKAAFDLNNLISAGTETAHENIAPFERNNNVLESVKETAESIEIAENIIEEVNVESIAESVEETPTNDNQENVLEQSSDIYSNEVESILPDFEALKTLEVDAEKPYIIYDKKEGLIPNYETPAFDPLFNNNYESKAPIVEQKQKIETSPLIDSMELIEEEQEELINFDDYTIDNNLFENSFSEIYIPLPVEIITTIELEKTPINDAAIINNETSKNEIENILEKFMRENPSISRPKTEFFNPASVAKTSAEEKDEIVSETLASIYLKQGLIKKSISTYEKLCLIYPLKNAYFAALINKIKTEHNIN